MSYLCYLCLFAHSGVQYILCYVFVFLRLVYPMLPDSLDFPFLIAPSVFSNVYSIYIATVIFFVVEEADQKSIPDLP